MSHECPVCGDLRGNGRCSNCGFDPFEDDKDDPLLADGGTSLRSPLSPLEECPECGRLVNRSVTGRRCPYCRKEVFDGGLV